MKFLKECHRYHHRHTCSTFKNFPNIFLKQIQTKSGVIFTRFSLPSLFQYQRLEIKRHRAVRTIFLRYFKRRSVISYSRAVPLRDLSTVLGDTLIPLLKPAFDHLYTPLLRVCCITTAKSSILALIDVRQYVYDDAADYRVKSHRKVM